MPPIGRIGGLSPDAIFDINLDLGEDLWEEADLFIKNGYLPPFVLVKELSVPGKLSNMHRRVAMAARATARAIKAAGEGEVKRIREVRRQMHRIGQQHEPRQLKLPLYKELDHE